MTNVNFQKYENIKTEEDFEAFCEVFDLYENQKLHGFHPKPVLEVYASYSYDNTRLTAILIWDRIDGVIWWIAGDQPVSVDSPAFNDIVSYAEKQAERWYSIKLHSHDQKVKFFHNRHVFEV